MEGSIQEGIRGDGAEGTGAYEAGVVGDTVRDASVGVILAAVPASCLPSYLTAVWDRCLDGLLYKSDPIGQPGADMYKIHTA
jgi:hypothetical protein